MGIALKLEGEIFGRLKVINRLPNNKYKKSMWLCECVCGNRVEVLGSQLKNKNTQSCGCLQIDKASLANKSSNKYDLSGDFGIGYDSKNNEFYFDLEDYDKIKDYCWYLRDKGYVRTHIKSKNKAMHRLILGVDDPSYKIDHINHITFDNRKSNLRVCNTSQNGMNMIVPKDNKSGHKGVRWHKSDLKWEAYIGVNRKYIYLGQFNNYEDAVKVRKEAEIKYHGDFRLKI